MSNVNSSTYPESWEVVKLGSLVESEKGKKPINQVREQSSAHQLPYIDIQAFEKGVINSWTDGRGCRICDESDFLMVWDGSRSGLVGKGMKGALGSTLVRINFPLMENQYAFYFLQSKYHQINSRAKGSGTPHVDPDLLWNYEFPIPPLNEQRRIVSKIEELFSELDKGIERLEKAREQLKIYRQAVLKQAFEGKLTEQWREEIKDKLETPEQLLNRIKREREAQYDKQLKKWNESVKVWQQSNRSCKKPSRPRSLSFPEPLTDMELTTLPEISSFWRWVKVGELFSVYVGATPSRKNQRYWHGEISWISSGEVCFTMIDRTKENVTQEGLANTSMEVHPVGTVMLGMIGEGKTRGQAAITRIEACHNQNTAAIRVSESEISPQYVYYYLLYRYEHTRRIGSGNNQKALNKERVSNLVIPLSTLDEQAVLIQALEKHLLVIAKINSEISSQLTSANLLRQSILKSAFAGQLVAQDPNDESASKILDRIRIARSTEKPKAQA